MTVEQSNVVVISCDNTSCPGNSLDPADRTGWLFISAEFYGQPTSQHVFCSVECLSTAAGDPDQVPAPPVEVSPPIEVGPPVPVEPVPVEPLEVA